MQSGDTPLHFACQNGHYEIVKALVEKLFEVKSRPLARLIVNIPNNVSFTVFHFCLVCLLRSFVLFCLSLTCFICPFVAVFVCLPYVYLECLTVWRYHDICVSVFILQGRLNIFVYSVNLTNAFPSVPWKRGCVCRLFVCLFVCFLFICGVGLFSYNLCCLFIPGVFSSSGWRGSASFCSRHFSGYKIF